MRWASTFLLAATTVAAMSGCAEDTIRDVGDSTLQATFRVEDEMFTVRVTNPETIEQLVDVWQRVSAATIPNGVIREGPGEGNHNEPWSWHLDPEEIEMAEATIEVCSGKPSDVEADLDYWINDVGRFCPWSAELILLEAL
jgi:hypothetical protein